MANNKNAIIRYQALDKCFRNTGRKYQIKDLVEACNEALTEFNGTPSEIKKRQIYDDIRFMQSEQGYSVELSIEKEGRIAYYKYVDPFFSISNQPLNEAEAIQLKEALITLKRFKGLPQFEWIDELSLKLEQTFHLGHQSNNILEFDSNPYLKGIEYLQELFNAIIYKKVIIVGYQTFKNDEVEEISMHPQYLKQFNNRWFVLGTNSKHKPVTTLSLDRIEYIYVTEEEYKTSDIDFMDRYEDVVGVTVYDAPLEKIILHAEPNLAPYILTKPFHGSQKIVSKSEDGLTFSIEVIPNYELESQILSLGEGLKVISPESVKEKVTMRIEQMLENYQ